MTNELQWATRVCAVAALLLNLLSTGCSTTFEVLKSKSFSRSIALTSSPPGQAVFLNKQQVGVTPTQGNLAYHHQVTEVTSSDYRNGLVLLITGLSGLAAGAGMIAAGAVIDKNRSEWSAPGYTLVTLGSIGATYGLIGIIYGAITMGFNRPRVIEETRPHLVNIGMSGPDGTFREVEIRPIDSNQRFITFQEIESAHFHDATKQWEVRGLRTLKAVQNTPR
jgi:hypothetical protein